MRIYFAHSFYDREKCRRIELRIEEELGIDIFNPFYEDDTEIENVASADRYGVRLEQFGAHGSLTDDECRDYVHNALKNIRGCDSMIVVPGVNQHEVQFCMMSARVLGKKIFVITDHHRDCPWYRFYSDCLFQDWGAFVEYISLIEGQS